MTLTPKIREDMLTWFNQCYEASKKAQLANGVSFNLTFEQYVALWGSRRIAKMTQLKDEGRLHARMGDPVFGYVLTWRNRAAYLTRVMDSETAQIATKQASKTACTLSKGEKHSPEAIKKIGDARRGKTHSPDAKAKIGAARKGTKHSPETLAKMRFARSAQEAAKRATRGLV